jgi:molybdopterin-binding protein
VKAAAELNDTYEFLEEISELSSQERSAEELNFNLGKKIYASFKATAVHVVK